MSTQRSDCLVDSSAAVPFVLATHDDHHTTFERLNARRLGLAGHAAFETFAVLTRLPRAARVSPTSASTVLGAEFPGTRFLSAEAAARLLERFAVGDIAGGSVFDALVGAVAVEHNLPLVTRDRRALPTYRALEVRVEFIA